MLMVNAQNRHQRLMTPKGLVKKNEWEAVVGH